MSLKDARKRRDEARTLLAQGIDPSVHKKATEEASKLRAPTTFNFVAKEYLDEASREGREAITIKKNRWLVSLTAADIGERPIAEITPAELLASLRKVEARHSGDGATNAVTCRSRVSLAPCDWPLHIPAAAHFASQRLAAAHQLA